MPKPPLSQKEYINSLPKDQVVWHYDAQVILQFLEMTFAPLPYFLKPVETDIKNYEKQLLNGERLSRDMLVDRIWKSSTMKVTDLHKLYRLFREQMPYSYGIENEYKFTLILRKMRYYKNRWEFLTRRLGGDLQIPALYPLKLRSSLTESELARFPIIKNPNLTYSQVEYGKEDLN